MEQIALNIDCMEYMKTVPDKYFDLAIVDPPYGNAGGGDARSIRNQKEFKELQRKIGIVSGERFDRYKIPFR